MAIERIDNGDGTTTFRGVDVTIPTSVAETHDVVEVRRPAMADIVEAYGEARKLGWAQQSAYVILAPHPTWKPPASLAPGEYEWRDCYMHNGNFSDTFARKIFRDWISPSREGRWRVNEDGTATYLGES